MIITNTDTFTSIAIQLPLTVKLASPFERASLQDELSGVFRGHVKICSSLLALRCFS